MIFVMLDDANDACAIIHLTVTSVAQASSWAKE
jgi:hypothetical protein